MNKNICIVHYNTPVLTNCLVRSINIYAPGSKVYIFDNSDKEPFVNTFENVTIFDNTHGQIIDFEKILEKYPGRFKSRGLTNNFGSAKHSMSVEKCIELIGDNFVLLDSDVLLKKNIDTICNEKYVWVGGVEDWYNRTLKNMKKRKRVCPFILFLNVKKMKEKKITFFDDEHMLGLNNGPKCEEYETGIWLFEKTPEKDRKIIDFNKYIIHFRGASWLEDARTKQNYKQIEPKEWLLKNKRYWTKNSAIFKKDWYGSIKNTGNLPIPEKVKEVNKPVKELFTKVFDHIYCLHNLPDSDRLPKLKEELKRVGIDEDAPYFSWKYDFFSPVLDCIYEDKRLNMDVSLRSSSRQYIKKVSMRHYEIIKEAYALGYKRILILENDVRFHQDLDYINKMLENLPDSDIVLLDKMTASSFKESYRYKERIKSLPEGALYADMSGIFFIFASCYVLNRKGMQHIIERQEDALLPPDTPFNDSGITGSFAVVNVAIQEPTLKTRKIESYDKIGLDISKYGPMPKPKAVIIEEKSKPVQQVPIQKIVISPKKSATRKSAVVKPTKPGEIKRVLEPVKTKPKPVPIKPKTREAVKLPVAKKNIIVLDKTKNVRTRKIPAATKNHNRLYDVVL